MSALKLPLSSRPSSDEYSKREGPLFHHQQLAAPVSKVIVSSQMQPPLLTQGRKISGDQLWSKLIAGIAVRENAGVKSGCSRLSPALVRGAIAASGVTADRREIEHNRDFVFNIQQHRAEIIADAKVAPGEREFADCTGFVLFDAQGH